MLFNSYLFIGVFLPITLTVYVVLQKSGAHKISLSWLVAASLFFYSWWNVSFLYILLGSILFNYLLSLLITKKNDDNKKVTSLVLLVFGVISNVGILFYFKYSDLIFSTVSGTAFILNNIALPLAISFFTLQQVAYLIDCHRNEGHEKGLLKYMLFVSFFPQLIAGPIVHHKEMMPQFEKTGGLNNWKSTISIGAVIFIAGLAKKVLIADSFAQYATPVFSLAEVGASLTIIESWIGALSYTFQLYFDFSGYSDMAIGLALMFGIRLPENFRSPYKATNIIDFWRRWHMTLSRFLRDYIYFPLGGNRVAKYHRYLNIMIVMTLGGIWHGAGLTFLFWGVFHGSAIVLNHFWHFIRDDILMSKVKVPAFMAKVVTFIVIVVGWVIFRAESLDAMFEIVSAMFGGNGITAPKFLAPYVLSVSEQLYQIFAFDGMFHNLDDTHLIGLVNPREVVPLIFGALILVWYFPNIQEIFEKYKPVLVAKKNAQKTIEGKFLFTWDFSPIKGVVVGVLLVLATLGVSQESPFLYFQF